MIQTTRRIGMIDCGPHSNAHATTIADVADFRICQGDGIQQVFPLVTAALALLTSIGCNQEPSVSEFAREVWAPTICTIEERCCGSIPENCQSSKSLKFKNVFKKRSRKYGAKLNTEAANDCAKVIREMTCVEWSLAQERPPPACSRMFSYRQDQENGEVCETGWQCESGVCLRDPSDSESVCTAVRQKSESCHHHQNCEEGLACVGYDMDLNLSHCEEGVPGIVCENDFDCASDDCSGGTCALTCRLVRVY